MKKFFYIFSLVIILSGFLAIIILRKQEKTVSFFTFPHAYNFVATHFEKEEIEVEIYLNRNDALLTKKQAISDVWISDSEKENILPLKLLAIDKNDNKMTVSDETYYGYDFLFVAELVTETDFKFLLPEAYLGLELRNGEIVFLKIGSFSLYKVSAFGSNDLSISRLQGIVNKIDDVKTLVGLCLTLKNKTSAKITVTDIKPLSEILHPALNDIVYPEERVIQSGEAIQELIGSYDPYTIETGKVTINIKPESELRILFPLKYKNLLPVKRLGFFVEYELNGETRKLYFNEFTFFTDYEFPLGLINSLEIQTHDNY